MGGREREARLTRAVADAADAWLRDPRDVHVYQRLVDAVDLLRAHRAGVVVRQVDADPAEAPAQAEELLDGLADATPVTVVGDLLSGSPQDVVGRLRQGAASGGDARGDAPR